LTCTFFTLFQFVHSPALTLMMRRSAEHESSSEEDSHPELDRDAEDESESDEGLDTDEEQEVLDQLHAQMEDIPFEEQLRAKRDGFAAVPKINPNAKRRSARMLSKTVEDDESLNPTDRRKERNRRQKRFVSCTHRPPHTYV
jgi:hypothetical protein